MDLVISLFLLFPSQPHSQPLHDTMTDLKKIPEMVIREVRYCPFLQWQKHESWSKVASDSRRLHETNAGSSHLTRDSQMYKRDICNNLKVVLAAMEVSKCHAQTKGARVTMNILYLLDHVSAI
jgi:hypothetical protein